jgi:uncharacterized membrane protein HdeD (DUF308 family)
MSFSGILGHTVAVPGDTNPSELRLSDVLDLLAALVALGLLTLIFADRAGVPRILLTLGFAFFVPGRAIVTNWPRVAAWSEAATAMVLSLGVLILLATITLWAHLWHPAGLLQVEALLSLALLGFGSARRHGRWPGLARGPARSRPPASAPRESA